MRRLSGLVLLGLAALPLTACGNNHSWNQKLTVTVGTPAGEVSGSAVTAISWSKNFFSGGWGGAAWHSEVKGEAVVVDLGGGRMLFALLSHSGSNDYIANLATRLVMDTTDRAWSKAAFAGVRNLDKPTPVPPKLYPLLVTFVDINDPKTVTKVDPASLAASFGAGYALTGVTLEVTREKVTEGEVVAVVGLEFFPRWGALNSDALANGGIGNSYFDTFASTLGRGNFIGD